MYCRPYIWFYCTELELKHVLINVSIVGYYLNRKLTKIMTYSYVSSSHPPPPFLPQDLSYKGVVKVTHDRGYALQTKSLLLESTTTSAEAVEQLFDCLGLRGSPSDYALEERNLMTGGKSR